MFWNIEGMILLIILIAALYLFYKFWVAAYKYWDNKGVPCIPGIFPFGSDFRVLFGIKFEGHVQMEAFRRFRTEPYYGMYGMRTPLLSLKDPEIISLVLTKEFSHFRDRSFFKTHDDDVLNQHLFNISGDKWRILRVKLSPTFTSGKMKMMFKHFIETAEVLDKVLLDYANTSVDIGDIVARFTTDIICSCAFGLESNAITDPDNELRTIGSKALKFDTAMIIKFILSSTFPKLSEFFRLKLTPPDVERFLLKTIKDVIHHRESTRGNRNDFIDLLLQLKNKGMIGGEGIIDEKEDHLEPLEMTEELMAAQCFVFFVAGFETSSSVQTFCLYELALNPDIQKRLQNEIDTTINKHGSLSYDIIKQMTYLTMVVSETVRKYPTLPTLMRVCTKELTIPGGLTIEKGTLLVIPVWALHNDPEYFPDPDRFDPERFSEENIDSIKPFTYLPFGEGPRFCIGKRFGLLQTKMGLITILRRYTVAPSAETQIPLQFLTPSPTTKTKYPLKLKLIPRNVS